MAYLDLIFSGPGAWIRNMMDAAEGNQAMGSWQRVPEKEAQAANMLGEGHFAFEYRDGPLKDAGILIAPTADGGKMLNIVPPGPQADQLDQAMQEALMRDFVERISPIAAEFAVRVSLVEVDDGSKGEFLARLPAEARKALDAFVVLANQDSLHVLDLQRWCAFLFELHAARFVLDADQVGNWLAQAHGWPDHSVERLKDQLDFAHDMLPLYDRWRHERG